MIGTLLRIGYLNLSRDRVALSLKFLLPIVFFSILPASSAAAATPRPAASTSPSSTRTIPSSAPG